jgi:nucleotide-binding universal stress UspA family protein
MSATAGSSRPDALNPGSKNLVVVGVDHSPGARVALAFAADEARLRGAKLRAVHAWQYSYIGSTDLEGAIPTTAADLHKLQAAAEESLEGSIAEALPRSDLEIEQRVVEGAPAAVLVEASRDADLLVVGSRGHGGFAQLLLGSVSQQCAHHAECPVVIVRSPREQA